MNKILWVFLLCLLLPGRTALGQGTAAAPIVGLRDDRPVGYALVGADVVIEPGRIIPAASVLIDGTSITTVSKDAVVPAGYKVFDCAGQRIYAGMIDAFSQVEVPLSDEQPAYWNSNITPQRNAASSVAANAIDDAEKLRSQGITVRVVAPAGGIMKGTSCAVLLGSQDGQRLLLDEVWHHAQLTVPRFGTRPRYPNSPMGATALLRQSLYDAQWYRRAWAAYEAQPTLPRPERNLALDVLSEAMRDGTFVFDAQNERMAIRAGAVADEFSLKWILRASGREYRQLAEIVAMNPTVLVPVDFPDAPDVQSAEAARGTSLQELLHWNLAPENPARLHDAGLTICLTTDGLDDPAKFLSKVRLAVDRGFDPDAALAAVTTKPAQLLGLSSRVGKVSPGMLANLIVCDGDLWDTDTEVKQCWVAGEPFVITEEDPTEDAIVGTWSASIVGHKPKTEFIIEWTQDGGRLTGQIQQPSATDESETDADSEQPSATSFENVVRGRDRLTATFDVSDVLEDADSGNAQLTIVTVGSAEDEVLASLVLPSGEKTQVRMQRQVPEAASPSDDVESPQLADENADAAPDEPVAVETTDGPLTPTLMPLGAYGLTKRITDQPMVLFRGATVWTCDDQGTLAEADVLIRDGRIVEVGTSIEPPKGCQVIDVAGKHITPGLIDCHSHMGTDGGVNESGQAVTAEVRIGDFIDNTDIHIYRQLAGGLTTSNILHGSANPIGGQNQVIKLRWGDTMDGLRMQEAPAGIKFALGENVKRSTSRYPNTRMGVEQVIRDQLLAAREYHTHWNDWNRGVRDRLPPRVDLQLQALSEIQRGERWIHCHSYRQDEIVATLGVLEEFGVQIGTLQHILEGYKVADRMAQHGAMASAFSDWWAYKFEVFDGIPYNGAIMHQRGVVVSFNSDDREIARHMNTEAAKATKYGGVPADEALKFVTLNPAKQLRIDEYVGSLTPGKHADLVVWSGRPLSTLSRCEQTWIDGRKYFDLETNRKLQQRDKELKAHLIQKVLMGDSAGSKPSDRKEVAEEERWDRYDAFCTARESARYQNAQRAMDKRGSK